MVKGRKCSVVEALKTGKRRICVNFVDDPDSYYEHDLRRDLYQLRSVEEPGRLSSIDAARRAALDGL